MNLSTASLFGSFSLAITLAACGGNVVVDTQALGGAGGATSTTTTTVFGGAGGIGGGFGGIGGTGGSVITGPAQTTGSSVSSSSGSSVTTSSSVASSSVASSSVSSSGSSTTSSSVASSSSGGTPVQVSCNGGPCMTGQICCFNPTGPGDHCGASGQCGAGFVEFSCNGPDDCPGSVCCATLDPNGNTLQGIACQATCAMPNEIVVCSQMQPNVCPSGTSCHGAQQLGTGAGYRFCVGG